MALVLKLGVMSMNKASQIERDKSVSMRAPQAEWAVIDRAAAAVGKTRTAFVLDAAKREAEDVLKERTNFVFSQAGWAELMETLDAPISSDERERVARLLARTPRWERGA